MCFPKQIHMCLPQRIETKQIEKLLKKKKKSFSEKDFVNVKSFVRNSRAIVLHWFRRTKKV